MFSILPCCQVELVLAIQWLIAIRLMGWILHPSDTRWLQRHSANTTSDLKEGHSYYKTATDLTGIQYLANSAFAPLVDQGDKVAHSWEVFTLPQLLRWFICRHLDQLQLKVYVCVCLGERGWGLGERRGERKEKQYAGRTSQKADQVWWRLLFHAKHPGKQWRPFSKTEWQHHVLVCNKKWWDVICLSACKEICLWEEWCIIVKHGKSPHWRV